MKAGVIIATIMALGCGFASAGGRPLDVSKSGPASWIQEGEGCGGDRGCLKCINDVRSRSGNLGLARQCITCINTANPSACYTCIPNAAFSNDIGQRAEECRICANQDRNLANGCSACLIFMPTLSDAQECKLCRSIRCFSCLFYTFNAGVPTDCTRLRATVLDLP